MGKFIEILNTSYKQSEARSKLEYLSEMVFDFTTYDSKVDELFAEKMIEVLECILNSKPFEYQQKSNEQYINYLTMVNMPFLVDKLEWGTSIRGAWFEDNKEYIIPYLELELAFRELTEFISDIIEWSK
jgi:hypothetical protein